MTAMTHSANPNLPSARWSASVAALGLVLATPAATWWLVGDQSVQSQTDLDYVVRLNVDPGVERLAGIAGLVLLAASVVTLLLASRNRGLDRRWVWVVGPLVVAGVIVGAGLRIVTAGVIGANIGAGFAVVFGAPVVAGLLLWALGRSLYLVIKGRRQSG